MSKKTAFIIITTVVILIALSFLAFYFYINQGQGTGIGTIDNRNNIFPPTPGGNNQPPAQTPDGTSGTSSDSGENGTTVKAILRELSKRPSAGAVAFATSSSQGITVRFIDRGTGNVYDVGTDTDGESRVSNTTIPKIQEALWSKNGAKVIARYIGDNADSIKTYGAVITKSPDQSEGSLQGSYLTDNIQSVTANPDQNKIFYLLRHSGGSTGIMSDFDGNRKIQLLDSPLQELLPSWPTNSLVALATKPATGVPGFLFLLNTKTGELTEAIAKIPGLTALVNPNGSKVLYSEIGTKGFFLKVYGFKNGSAVYIAVATLPEKCVWSKNTTDIAYCAVPGFIPDGNYPDDWYKGLVSFSDEIWKINTETGAGELLQKLNDATPQGIDGVALMLSPDEDYLFFTNKKDYHLWSLRLVP